MGSADTHGVEGAYSEVQRGPSSAAAFYPLSWNAWQVREIAENAMKPYIFDDASTLEYQRLDLMSKILDPWTREYLTALGVGQGWQCLELGGGNGSIAEWLCAKVGPSGSVTAIDINPAILGLIPAQNLTVEQMDVRTGELPANAYDLVTCRALLHQISDYAPAVLGQMAAALKPGGWLLIQEPDFHLAPTTEPEVWAKTWKALIEWGRANGVDWLIGRKLPTMVGDLGLGRPLQASLSIRTLRSRRTLWLESSWRSIYFP